MPIKTLHKILKGQKSISISKIEWWLLKYSNLQKKTLHFIDSKKEIFELEDGSSVCLPPLDDSVYDTEKKFLNLYNALDTISEFHKNEKYFEQEMLVYQEIKNSKTDLKNWVAKNEKLGAGTDELFLFSIECLDLIKDKEVICIYSKNNFEINVDKVNFKYIIEFLDVFDNLFWIKKVYPESEILIRLEKDMNNKMLIK